MQMEHNPIKTTLVIDNNLLFTRLYKSVYPAVARYVSRRGGSFDEAKDVFQDAMMIWYEKSITTDHPPLNEKAYLMGIAKHLWLKNHRESGRYIPLEEAGNMADISDEQLPLSDKLLTYLEASGQKCMDLLKSFYYDKFSMDEIASAFGFSGIRSATVQKFKCLEKVRDTVKNKALSYEDFVE